ncbi:MAG: ribosomal protein S18-alanine N-acetyltransferase [Cellvibrionaceae bacterium]|nr:ribosomal protein S18-alanine N-acetyltransferase [Cellvibrionaceae bacterium]
MSSSIQSSFEKQFTLSNGQNCVLRNFAAADIEYVVEVERSANPHPWSERNFIDSVQSSHICILCDISDEAVAHSVFSIAAGEAELLILSVHPMWQRHGIARGILTYMFQELEDYAAEMFLEVRESNDRAISLYENLGFNAVGTRPAYYPNGAEREDALIYARSLRITK